MDNTRVSIAEIVQREIEAQAQGWWVNGSAYAISDRERQIHNVVFVPTDYPRPFHPGVVVMVRVLADDTIIIEQDTSDRPLLDDLLRAGVPRKKIVLAYAGETLDLA